MVNSNRRIIIVGSTGYLGQHLIKASKAAGYETHALCRSPEKLSHLRAFIDKVIVADVTKAETLKGAFDKVDIVISALGITRQKDGLNYWDVDYQANKNVLEAALDGNVKQFGYVHVLNADKMKSVDLVKAKSAFVSDLQAAPIISTICCPSGFFSDLDEFYKMAQNGRVFLFGSGQNFISPIHGQDAAQACLEAVNDKTPWVKIGGPRSYTQLELARLAFEVLGKPEAITPTMLRPALLLVKLLKRCGLRSQLGPIEFFLAASAIDMSAPMHGRFTVTQYFEGFCASDLEQQYIDMARTS